MQKILLIRGSGGLSNRLQAVLAGIAHCLLTGRALCVDWRDGMYSDDFSNVFPRWFGLRGLTSAPVPTGFAGEHCVGPDSNGTDGAGATVYPPFWYDWLSEAVAVEYLFANDHLSPDNVALTSIDFSRLDYEQDILVGWGADLQAVLAVTPLLRQKAVELGLPLLAHADDSHIIRWLAHNCLELKPHLGQRVEDFATQHFSSPHIIGLHIRHTDLQSPIEDMLSCVRGRIRPDSIVFLCTDNKHVQSTVSRIFPRTVYTTKVYPAGGEPLHCFVPELSNVQKGEEALIDMYLLSKCHEIVYYSQSSFSRIPIVLGDFAPENIHAL